MGLQEERSRHQLPAIIPETESNPNEKILLQCPVGGYNLCPSDEIDSTPDPNEVNNNPLGTCGCEGELWVSRGCSFGFYCNSSLPKGGEILNCGGKVKNVNFNI